MKIHLSLASLVSRVRQIHVPVAIQNTVRFDALMSCWFSYDVTKIRTTKLFIHLIFYFHDAEGQLKAGIHATFLSEWVLSFVVDYA